MEISKDIAAVGRYLRRQRNRYMAPLGLKSIHARILLDILEYPGISQDGLAQRVGFDKSNVARQVAVLEELGFISRTPAATDKRVMELYPTAKTLQILPEITSMLLCWENCITQDLSEADKEALSRLLSKMSHRASRYMEDR